MTGGDKAEEGAQAGVPSNSAVDPTTDVLAEPQDGEGGGEEVASDLEQLFAERDEYLDQLRRAQADFENYRKRVAREQAALVGRATEALVEKLLPVLDAFELALLNADAAGVANGDIGNLRKGVELVYAELLGTLEQLGLERIDAQGAVFDPMLHEAVVQVEAADGEQLSDNAEPVVVDVLRTGYRFGSKLLRAAMVKVAK